MTMTDAPSVYRADDTGHFGEFGGAELPPFLVEPIAEVAVAYEAASRDPEFQAQLQSLLAKYVGRPSLLYFAENLTKELGGAKIYLKREDLNHTGAHKINHCLGEALLAKRMGKKKVIAETGAGQHGVALATAAALVGLECEIHMGAIDVAKQHPNVVRMELLGAKVVAVEEGGRSLKEAVDSAFGVYASAPDEYFFAIGSARIPTPQWSAISSRSLGVRRARRSSRPRGACLTSSSLLLAAGPTLSACSTRSSRTTPCASSASNRPVRGSTETDTRPR